MKSEKKSSGVLYRKYRPQTFQDVIGQHHIVKVLEGSIKLGNVAHAYLFSGPRGTGKTSVARIFSREIGTSPNDLIEMDAASQTSVNDVRALSESVHTLPYESKYKVYILDEAHMLSRSAFNALLKTLEEPPSHVVFILATTEAHKLPKTIISRCVTVTFSKATRADLVSSLQRVCIGFGDKKGLMRLTKMEKLFLQKIQRKQSITLLNYGQGGLGKS